MSLGHSPLSSNAISGGSTSGVGGPSTTPIAGAIPVSLTATATLKLGISLAGNVPVALTADASIQTGTHLAATANAEVTPRGRMAGAAATPGTGNFFLLF